MDGVQDDFLLEISASRRASTAGTSTSYHTPPPISIQRGRLAHLLEVPVIRLIMRLTLAEQGEIFQTFQPAQ